MQTINKSPVQMHSGKWLHMRRTLLRTSVQRPKKLAHERSEENREKYTYTRKNSLIVLLVREKGSMLLFISSFSNEGNFECNICFPRLVILEGTFQIPGQG